ncbi:MAG TPA: EamA family transporter [Glaciihabitans sp.]|nr:EamA family transporter [Glaciihabitans sp.]
MRRSVPLPASALAVTAMLSVQLGSALSVDLIATVGAAGTAWLRLTAGAVIFLLLVRPPLHLIRRRDVPVLVGLGVATGLMSIAFLAAIERIPLGTAVAIEFLGPLTVAAVRSDNRRALAWPSLALVGVILLTEPWMGSVDALGVMFAVLAGACWAGYIVLTKQVGDRFTGIDALSMTIPIAAITAAVVGVPQAAGHLSWQILLIGVGLAFLLPVVPFALEMLALRRMSPTAFGTLMAVEPAIGVVIGLIVLQQSPGLFQAVGILLVVTAGAAAQRRTAQPVISPADTGFRATG